MSNAQGLELASQNHNCTTTLIQINNKTDSAQQGMEPAIPSITCPLPWWSLSDLSHEQPSNVYQGTSRNSPVTLEHYYYPLEQEMAIPGRVEHYNHER